MLALAIALLLALDLGPALAGPPLALAAAAVLLAFGRRRLGRLPLALAAAAVLVAGAARAHLQLAQGPGAARAAVESLRVRAQALADELERVAHAAATDLGPAASPSDGAAFVALEALSAASPLQPALAWHDAGGQLRAWSGRPTDLPSGIPFANLFVRSAPLTTSLVAVSAAPGQGFVTAEVVVRSQRTLAASAVPEIDRLGSLPGARLEYVALRDRPPSATEAATVILADRDGRPLVRLATAIDVEALRTRRAARWRSVLGLVLLALGAALASRCAPSPLQLAGVITALRLVLAALGVPFLPQASSLAAPAFTAAIGPPWLSSPLELLLSAAWLAALAALACQGAAGWRGRPLGRLPATTAATATALGTAAAIAWLAHHSAIELGALTLSPTGAAQLALHVALLLLFLAGLALATTFLRLAGDAAATSARARALLAGVAGLAALLPLARALELGAAGATAAALLAAALGLDLTRTRWQPAAAARPLATRAALVVPLAAFAGLALAPGLDGLATRRAEQRLEQQLAPVIRQAPERRRALLDAACRRLDALMLLEQPLPGRPRPAVEELAFAAWTTTPLAETSLASAVEIQDAAGALVSRFAYRLPRLAAGEPLPASERWQLTDEVLTVASARLPVLHAARRLVYHDETHGAVHVYVGQASADLPFVGGPPAQLLQAAEPSRALHGAGLVVYDPEGRAVASTVERPPAWLPAWDALLRAAPEGAWTDIQVEARPARACLLAAHGGRYLLLLPRATAATRLAALVESATAAALVALAGLVLLVGARTLLGRERLSLGSMLRAVRRRFALRLFVGFVVLAVLPAAVVQALFRSVVAHRLRQETERLALERASVARKAVEDFAFFQRGESPAAEPVTDAALVWVARLLGNDVDVYDAGRLRASSQRELYASGLLSPRLPGVVQRSLALEGAASAFHTERLGSLPRSTVSVPLDLDGRRAVLSLPLALPERQLGLVLTDVDRRVRLATTLFLALAAALALSFARRISDPLRELTRATRRVADGDFQARVQPRSEDELRALVDAFNRMAAELERQGRDLERSHRQAAWAEMARQVAHEVKNPLTPIQLSAEHLRRVYREDAAGFPAALDACTEAILRQVRTLRALVTEFTALARPPVEPLERIDVAELARGVARPYAVALPPGVSLRVAVDPAFVRGDRRLLERAVVNLVENALEAVGQQGVIALRTRADASGVHLEVEDDGRGMSAEAAARAFEPFFSTRTSGSGLGLALVKKIVEDVGGSARLEPRDGPGTRVVLSFPADDRSSPPHPPHGGGEDR